MFVVIFTTTKMYTIVGPTFENCLLGDLVLREGGFGGGGGRGGGEPLLLYEGDHQLGGGVCVTGGAQYYS